MGQRFLSRSRPEILPLKFDLNLVPHGMCMLIYEYRSSKIKLCFRNFQKTKMGVKII